MKRHHRCKLQGKISAVASNGVVRLPRVTFLDRLALS
jgi:hypothetical protein